MMPLTAEHRLAFRISGALTAVLAIAGGIWLYAQRPDAPPPLPPTDVVSDAVIDAGLRYTQTLPWIAPGVSTVYQRADVLGDGVIGLVYTAEMEINEHQTRQSILVLHQDGRVIGHETRVADPDGIIEIVAPEPEQIVPADQVLVRAYTKLPAQAVTLTLTEQASGRVIYEEQRVSSAENLVAFAVRDLPSSRGQIVLSLASDSATVSYPVYLDQAP